MHGHDIKHDQCSDRREGPWHLSKRSDHREVAVTGKQRNDEVTESKKDGNHVDPAAHKRKLLVSQCFTKPGNTSDTSQNNEDGLLVQLENIDGERAEKQWDQKDGAMKTNVNDRIKNF